MGCVFRHRVHRVPRSFFSIILYILSFRAKRRISVIQSIGNKWMSSRSFLPCGRLDDNKIKKNCVHLWWDDAKIIPRQSAMSVFVRYCPYLSVIVRKCPFFGENHCQFFGRVVENSYLYWVILPPFLGENQNSKIINHKSICLIFALTPRPNWPRFTVLMSPQTVLWKPSNDGLRVALCWWKNSAPCAISPIDIRSWSRR